MGVRTGLVMVAWWLDPAWLWIMGMLAVLVVLGWLRIMYWAPRDKGPETFGGRIWWQSYRKYHVLTYSVFAAMAFAGSSHSWVPLAVDVVLGFGLYMQHHMQTHPKPHTVTPQRAET